MNRILNSLPDKDRATVICFIAATGMLGVSIRTLLLNLSGRAETIDTVSAAILFALSIIVILKPEPFGAILAKLITRKESK